MAQQDLGPKISDFITRQVQAATNLKVLMAEFNALHQEYQDNGYFEMVNQDHISGDNLHMTPGLIASVFSSYIAINDFMETNFHDDVIAQASR